MANGGFIIAKNHFVQLSPPCPVWHFAAFCNIRSVRGSQKATWPIRSLQYSQWRKLQSRRHRPTRVKHHGIHRSPHSRDTESSNEKDLRPLRWQTSLSTFPCRRRRFQVFVIYMEMSTTSTRTAGAESVSAIFIFVSAIFDFVSAKIHNGSAKFGSSACKSRYGRGIARSALRGYYPT